MDARTRIKTKLPESVYNSLVARRDARAYREMSVLDTKDYPTKLMQLYERRMGKSLDLENPRTFNEKIQWLKLYDSSAEKGMLADKYQVRAWAAEQIGAEHLIPLLGVWSDPSEIDFDALPNSFVLKATHASGWNIIVPDKADLDVAKARRKMRRWMETDFAMTKPTMELHYRYCSRRIIAEEFMDFDHGEPVDYRFFCSYGEVFSVWEDVASGTLSHRRNIYDPEWNLLPSVATWPKLGATKKPVHYDEMLRYAQDMSRDFSFVRVDFYDYDETVLFGEMTFTPMAGYVVFEPESFDAELGGCIALPQKKIAPGESRGIESVLSIDCMQMRDAGTVEGAKDAI